MWHYATNDFYPEIMGAYDRRVLEFKSFLILALTLLVSTTWASETYQAKVIGISDGDTITVFHGGVQTKIRLYGIDTPEKRQAFGNKAKQFTADNVFGVTVDVIPMDTDRYGRTVALIQPLGYSETLNEALVRQGLAWVYRKYCHSAFCSDWLGYEKMAQTKGMGLWADPSPVPPWQFRKRK